MDLKILHKERKKCKSKSGYITFTFKDLVNNFYVNGFRIDGILRPLEFDVLNKFGDDVFETKKLESDFKVGEINYLNFEINNQTEIIVNPIPYGREIELSLFYKENMVNYKLSGGHVSEGEVVRSIQPFYMVFADNPKNYNKVPTVRHATEEEAEAEALRISDKEKCEVYILKSVKKLSLIPKIEKIY